MDTSGHRKAVADRKASPLPPSFEWYSFRVIGDAIAFEGASVVGTISKGKRKGQKKWGDDVKAVVVTQAEELAEYHRFEAETGKCGDCLGEGRVFSGWSAAEGVKYRPCGKCSAAEPPK